MLDFGHEMSLHRLGPSGRCLPHNGIEPFAAEHLALAILERSQAFAEKEAGGPPPPHSCTALYRIIGYPINRTSESALDGLGFRSGLDIVLGCLRSSWTILGDWWAVNFGNANYSPANKSV